MVEEILELIEKLKNNKRIVISNPSQESIDEYYLWCCELDEISDWYHDDRLDKKNNEEVKRILTQRELVSKWMSQSASGTQAKIDCIEYIIEHNEADKIYKRLRIQIERYYGVFRHWRDKLRSLPSKMN